VTTLLRTLIERVPARSTAPAITFDQWLSYFTFNGSSYPLSGISQTLQGTTEQIEATFTGLVQSAYRRNGIVFAIELARLMLFTQARFEFQALRGGQPGELFATPELGILETPWPNAVTGDLLSRALLQADLAGNAFIVRRTRDRSRLHLVKRPDWMVIISGSTSSAASDAWDIDADVVGYAYYPGGLHSGNEPEFLLPDEVAHFAPVPDPLAAWRGMSWLVPVVREIMADGAATDHKLRFFENGATPNMVVALDPAIPPQAFKDWVALFKEKEPKGLDVYRTLYLGGGAKVEVVGSDLKQLDFKITQGAGETRIAAAGGVPPVIAGFSEGLQAATYSNYGQARRRFAELFAHPAWQNIAGSLQSIVPPPPGSRLWYDARHIPFLREDAKDRAEIQGLESRTIRTLVDAGYTPESVVAAVKSEDWSRLIHTGLFSVQLQAPGTKAAPPSDDAGRALAALVAPHLPTLIPASTNGDRP